jgi:hypothetical protein
LAFFVLEETLPSKKLALDERVPLLPEIDVEEDGEHYSHDENTIDSMDTAAEADRPSSLLHILQDKAVWAPILIYGIISSYYTPYDEVFALYSRLDHSLG